jgi:hypothetical protein
MKKLIFLFFVILSSSAFAFDCSIFNDQADCNELNKVNESLIADLIYQDISYPNHEFIYNYNSKIDVTTPPYDAEIESNGYVKNAWFTILTVMPSILYEDNLIVDGAFQLRSEYDYDYFVPSTYTNNKKNEGSICKIKYYLHSKSDNLKLYANGNYVGNQKIVSLSVNKPTELKGIYSVSVTIRKKIYEWDYDEDEGWDCDYEYTDYDTNSVTIEDSIDVISYTAPSIPKMVFLYQYNDNLQGKFTNSNNNLEISFANSYYRESFYGFSATFSKEPYYFLTIKANNISSKKIKNLYVDNNTILVKDAKDCMVSYSNFFNSGEIECEYDLEEMELKQFEKIGFSDSWNFLFVLVVFVFICFLIYTAIKRTWGKYLIAPFCVLLIIPSTFAAECGLTNLASCIPEKMYEFFIGVLNAPLQPLLFLVRSLMENPPSIDLFLSVWAIMVYCVSLFYGFLFIYSGFQFLFSGHNVIKREIAKEWLRNSVIMITLIQASFYLYGLVLEISAMLTSSVLSMVDEKFFLLTADNIANIGLEFLCSIFYVLVLFITILLLLIRYLIVSFGVIYVPVGLFCYFIPPLRSYGKLVLHMLGSFIFITFIDAVIILGCSMLIEIPLFENIKILVMIACFSIINIMFIIMTIKAIFKAVFSSGGGESISQAVKYIAMLA